MVNEWKVRAGRRERVVSKKNPMSAGNRQLTSTNPNGKVCRNFRQNVLPTSERLRHFSFELQNMLSPNMSEAWYVYNDQLTALSDNLVYWRLTIMSSALLRPSTASRAIRTLSTTPKRALPATTSFTRGKATLPDLPCTYSLTPTFYQ